MGEEEKGTHLHPVAPHGLARLVEHELAADLLHVAGRRDLAEPKRALQCKGGTRSVASSSSTGLGSESRTHHDAAEHVSEHAALEVLWRLVAHLERAPRHAHGVVQLLVRVGVHVERELEAGAVRRDERGRAAPNDDELGRVLGEEGRREVR